MEFLTLFEEVKLEHEYAIHANRMNFAAKADRLTRYNENLKANPYWAY